MVKGPSLTVFLFNSEALIATPGLVHEHFSTHCNSPVLLYSQTCYSSTERNNINVMWVSFDNPLMIILLISSCVAPLTVRSLMGTVDSLPVISSCSYVFFNLSLVFCSFRISCTFLELSEILVAALTAYITDSELTSVLFPGYIIRPNCWFIPLDKEVPNKPLFSAVLLFFRIYCSAEQWLLRHV